MIMKAICVQLDIVWENKPANHAKVRELLDAARPDEGDLVVLPEMFATGFSMKVKAITDHQSRETQNFLAQTAAEYRVYLLGGVVTVASDGRGRNECAIYSAEGKEIGRYCKMHPFTLGGESQHYVAGANPLVLPCQEFILSPFICYDLRFPEVFRAAVRRGANLFAVIANWPTPRVEHWVTLLKARAIENQAYVVGVNRCGNDPNLPYPGQSMIIDPRGQVLIEAGDLECTISAEFDLQTLLDYREEFPFLSDMREDSVDPKTVP
jgi:predicted amidohydrolase